MGAANSQELSIVPLRAQCVPVIGTHSTRSLPKFLTFQAIRVNWYSRTFTVVDTATGVEHFRIVAKPLSLSGRRTIYGPDGDELMYIKHKSMSRSWTAFRGEESDDPMFEIVVKTRLASIDFRDQTTGAVARIWTELSYDDRVALVVLERKGVRSPVARIRRPSNGVFEPEEFFFEVAAGADTLLVTLLWFVRFKYLEQQRKRN